VERGRSLTKIVPDTFNCYSSLRRCRRHCRRRRCRSRRRRRRRRRRRATDDAGK